MYIQRFIFVGLIVCGLSACSNYSTPDVGASDVTSELPATTVPDAAGAQVAPVLIAGKVPLNFPHTVRSNTEAAVDGVVTHNLRVEYKELDESAVSSAILKAFTDAGYKVRSDDTKSVAMKDSEKIRYAISPAGPDLKVAMSSPESKGLVTFIW